ncbi:MAG: TrkH family potassium uptake protein [Rhodobacteraceae bacterium]|nr:TrkH family potassium uptake protein [Paracoccaceae bacterium]
MFDMRPTAYVTGLIVAALGATMLVPLGIELYDQNGQWRVFAVSAIITCGSGVAVSLSTNACPSTRLTLQQTFLLTTGVWFVLPIFAAIPFMLGATNARAVDAFFEAMSGLTTTGATVVTGLDELPRGLLFWRAMMQWFGGIGIVIVAMVFLPVLRVGGMQIFQSEEFDPLGKILPRAAEVARRIFVIYATLTIICLVAYQVAGLGIYDALYHALTTISTGGFSSHDASFGAFKGGAEYVACLFMLLSALPFVRFVQLMDGSVKPLLADTQIRVFLLTYAGVVGGIAACLVLADGRAVEPAVREIVFNAASIMTGTGYASTDYQLWGPFPVMTLFLIGLIGGCAGSTSCSVKIFRYQILFASIFTQIRNLHSPSGVFTVRFSGHPVSDEVIASVIAFFTMFFVTLVVLAVGLSMTGLDLTTSVSGAAAALANIGPGLGAEIGPAGTYAALNDTAKWLLSFGMLIGRLELMVVFVFFTVNFWRP